MSNNPISLLNDRTEFISGQKEVLAIIDTGINSKFLRQLKREIELNIISAEAGESPWKPKCLLSYC